MKGQVARAHRLFVGADLSVAGVRTRISLGHLRPDQVEQFNLLKLPHPKAGAGHLDQRGIAQPKVLNRPEHHDVEVLTTAESAEYWSNEIAAAAESARAKPQHRVG